MGWVCSLLRQTYCLSLTKSTFHRGNPRAPLQKGVSGNSNGPPPKKKKEGESKSGSKSGEKKDDKKDGKTDEEKDGESRSDSETSKTVV